MTRRLWVYGVLFALVPLTLAATAAAEPIEGILEADAPATLDGHLETQIADPTVLLTDLDAPTQAPPLVLKADKATITNKQYDVSTVTASNPVQDYSFETPAPGYDSESYIAENVTIEITPVGTQADFLLSPTSPGVLQAAVNGTANAAQVNAYPDGVRVLDGHREHHNFTQSDEGDERFHYNYSIDRPLVSLKHAPSFDVWGHADGYAWDAHVLVRNQTGTIASYETGMESTSTADGTLREEHYEYVTFALQGLQAEIPAQVPGLKLMERGFQMSLDGTLGLEGPGGSLSASEGVYNADSTHRANLDGSFSLTLMPSPDAQRPHGLSLGLNGEVDETTLPMIDTASRVPTEAVVAASAGGVTVLGVALWYALSAKGASLALVGAVRTPQRDEEALVATDVEDPGELLHDPDRFTLYHLVRSRVGLSAEECRELTGIGEAPVHLRLLARHGLLETIAEDPQRYTVPGLVAPEDADRIAFLRRPGPRQLAELLAMHGLTPEDRLLERVEARPDPPAKKDVPKLLEAFTDKGLVYREPGEDGRVVDPTDRLLSCLDQMGEGNIPQIS